MLPSGNMWNFGFFFFFAGRKITDTCLYKFFFSFYCFCYFSLVGYIETMVLKDQERVRSNGNPKIDSRAPFKRPIGLEGS